MGRTTAFALAAVAALIAPVLAPAGEVRVGARSFTLLDGFEIEQVAGPPLVDRPIVADFDERGRLYVADSSGSNDPVEVQLKNKPHRIVRLEDTDGDGRYDRRTVFADRLMFPEGAMWLGGSLYVSAPPSIWKLTDTDGDGVADRREEWFQGGTLTGCANDLHGPYLGPDGWIYWCKGAFAEQTHDRPGRSPLVTKAAHLFRRRPEGGPVESVMTGGMDNPVEVVFTPGGERIVSATFLQHPGGGRRDGLIHALYGGVYGKVHEVIDEHPRTGPEVLPALAHLGPAAPCGLARCESDSLGEGFRDNLFAAQFNLRKVSRHVLEPDGASFKTRDEDFLTTPDLDFHPTDVLEDADGSLLVLDTGGWYKLCCPTSQIVKPDVLGAIYRIRRAGAPKVEDPRGLTLPWARMGPARIAGLLGDPRPAVRRRAIQALADEGPRALAAIGEPESVEARRNGVWAATRRDEAAARVCARRSLADPDESVRQAAIHSASVRRDAGALPALLDLLKAPSPQNRRAAAEAIGRIGEKSAVPALLDALSEADPADRALGHSLTFALIEIADPVGTAAGLAGRNAAARRAALVAMDQMEGGGLSPVLVVERLSSDDPATRDAAAWILGRHPDWGGALTGYLRGRLDANGLPAAERADLERFLGRFAGAETVRRLLADRVRDDSAPADSRAIALAGMARSGLAATPRDWVAALTMALGSEDPEIVRRTVATLRALPVPGPNDGAAGLARGLRKVADGANAPVAVRLDALAAVPGGLAEVPPDLFRFLRAQLDPACPVAARTLAAGILARAALDDAQLSDLTAAVPTAGPLELAVLLAAFDRSSHEDVGTKLVSALKRSPAAISLRAEAIRPHLAKFGEAVRKGAEDLYATLDVDARDQGKRLDGLAATLPAGDIRRGQVVFNGTKAACASCHAIGYLGGSVGPDLTSIGKVRARRDLLESIVYPSASFVRSFEPMSVATKDGKVFHGVLKGDGPEGITLATGANEVVRIARDDLEELRPGTVSLMPAGLDTQLTPAELADLLAFLQSRQ